MDLDKNPYLQPPPDPFQYVKDQQKALQKEQVEMERLCFEYFIMSDQGKKMADLLLEKFILPSHFAPNDQNADKLAIWWDGFKSALRGLSITNGRNHQKRIQQGEPR